MDKDIFVDNNIAKNFCNPLDEAYKKFIRWLFEKGFLIVSNKILAEYHSSTCHSFSPTNIVAIIDRLTRDGRLKKISNRELKAFEIKNHVLKRLKSNRKDHEHLKIVMLSDRKYAISLDKKFRDDVNNFTGYRAKPVSRPEEIPYESS